MDWSRGTCKEACIKRSQDSASKKGHCRGVTIWGLHLPNPPWFYPSYTSAPGEKRKHSLRSSYEVRTMLILKPKKDKARKNNDGAI